MGTSFVHIKENGFWVRDGILELFLRLAALHIDEPKDGDSFQACSQIYEIRNKWLLASKGYFTGCVPDCIDEIASDETGKLIMVKAINKLLSRLKKSPPT